MGGVAPNCDQQLTRHGDDSDAAGAPLQISDTVAKPTCQAAVWLITQPEPGELDERLARPRIAGPAYPPITIHSTALERCWGEAEITGDLPTVLERAIEHFTRQNGGEILTDASSDR
jgi:hypothetical protein